MSAAGFSDAAVDEALEEDREVRMLRSTVVGRLMEVWRDLGLSSFYLRRAMIDAALFETKRLSFVLLSELQVSVDF